MPDLPQQVQEAWEHKEGPAVFATVSETGQPNVAYVGSVKILNDSSFVLMDRSYVKTRANILSGSRGSLLFMAPDCMTYQIYGTLEYLTSGPLFDDLPNWADRQFIPVAAVVLHVEEVYNGPLKMV